jgi:hypothetical protein
MSWEDIIKIRQRQGPKPKERRMHGFKVFQEHYDDIEKYTKALAEGMSEKKIEEILENKYGVHISIELMREIRGN